MSNPKNNYKNGRAKEYRVMKRYKENPDNIVIRSAGSHSPVDIIAINTKEKYIKMIQCKPKSMSAKKVLDLSVENKDLNGIFTVEYVVVLK